ncbi:hypothetical protein RN001_013490 [Aquatica leii]|uniref:Vacuolar protein sorting-associated protein 11 homolog n=1 Tax=Aquatica leii TaxID=1421715 RepID=A0AAN7PZX3_9COLE|nr:hypothetical protein RN001_013490 [Aquatica leii]
MAFLEWRKFNFFDIKADVDKGCIADLFKESDIVVATCGNNEIVLGDSLGQIHLLSRSWEVTSFRGYELRVTLAQHLRNSTLLITIGEDEPGINPIIKVWNTKRDKNGVPHCCRVSRTLPGNKPVAATALCVHEGLQLMAVGFADGSLLLYRGEITRDRGSKQKLLRDVSSAVTGLAFKSTASAILLFVSTDSSICVFNVTHKDREQKCNLDTIGCAKKCSVLAESVQESHFMVARNDAIYCYTSDGRGPCFAVDGEKVMLEWFRSYLIIISTASKSAVSSISGSSSQAHSVTILDIQNKFIVFSTITNKIKAALIEWGGLYLLDCNNRMYHLDEKDLQSKLLLLFKKNLYDVSIRIAKSQQYDADGLADIFRQYGDHLYAKGDYWGAIEQYAKTSGRLEPSYVIRKFLESQHIEKLTSYLQTIHKQGQATEDHTTLLLNCYTKLNKPENLKEFILLKDRDLDFNVEIAIKVCRQASPQEALMLAKKHKKHDWYIKIEIEDNRHYKEALEYISELNFEDAEIYTKKYGQILIKNVARDSTNFLKRLCTNFSNKSAASEVVHEPAQKADPEDYIHLFLNDSEHLVEFLEHLIAEGCILSTSVYDTLHEHYLHVWSSIKNETEKNKYGQKILKFLQNSEIKYNKPQALVVCHMHNFSEGVLYLYEEEKLYQQILRYHILRSDSNSILSCCRRFGHQEPSLWIQALWSCIRGGNDSLLELLPEVLKVIAKERLLSPQLIIEAIGASESNITLAHIRSYIENELKIENEIISDNTDLTNKYNSDTVKLKQQIELLKNGVNVVQGSRCAACHHQLELPSIHFLCQHSYHQHCFQSFSDNENECPACVPQNKNLLELLKAQEYNKDLHETFHAQLEKVHDGFSVAAEYFGRGVFKKVTVVTDGPDKKLESVGEILKSKQEIKMQTYGPGAEARLRQIENARSGGTSIVSVPEGRIRQREHQYGTSFEKKFTETTAKPVKGDTNNPFEDEYDESKNPFSKEDLDDTNPFKDDYDKNLNPFES